MFFIFVNDYNVARCKNSRVSYPSFIRHCESISKNAFVYDVRRNTAVGFDTNEVKIPRKHDCFRVVLSEK